MTKQRTEAFSDAVFAIIITIMVLELKVPHEPTWAALADRWAIFISYALSFITVGVFWMSHHRLLDMLQRVDGKMLWLNLHMLFWMSLIPFVTAWMGETLPASTPALAYGLVMFMTGLAVQVLARAIAAQRTDAEMRTMLARQARKGVLSTLAYAVALTLASFRLIAPALVLYLLIALAWVLPDKVFGRRSG